MKKKYQQIEVDITIFTAEDVMDVSGFDNWGDDDLENWFDALMLGQQ